MELLTFRSSSYTMLSTISSGYDNDIIIEKISSRIIGSIFDLQAMKMILEEADFPSSSLVCLLSLMVILHLSQDDAAVSSCIRR
jgi:hypothetical protein